MNREMTDAVRAHMKKNASIVPEPWSEDYFPWSGWYTFIKISTGTSFDIKVRYH